MNSLQSRYKMDTSKILFRASAIGNLMSDPMSKADKEAGNLSESAKTHCIDIFVREKYGRQTDISNKYIEKGLMVEEDAITLYSRVKKHFFKKNEDHLNNEFVRGTPDLYTGETIQTADTVIDIKSSWDIFTFFRAKNKKINPLYYWQLQTYMALTGATKATLAYCLVDTPESFINDEKRKIFYKMNITTEENEVYQEACKHLQLAMTYEDIPLAERVAEFHIERDDDGIEKMYKKVEKGREYLKQLMQETELKTIAA